MAVGGSTARSEISSAISDDGISSRPQSGMAQNTTPTMSQSGYTHLRGVMNPSNRSIRSPIPPSTHSGSSRPNSPMSHASRTHVPSITAQGFLRPMSSQKLQAQRMTRVGPGFDVPPPVSDAGEEDFDNRSLTSSRQGPYAPMPRGHRISPSVTTTHSVSDVPDNASRGYAPPMNYTYPDQQTGRVQPPSGLNINDTLRVGSIREDPKSPGSARSNTSYGSRQMFDSSHQQLGSTEGTPRPSEKDFPVGPAYNSNLGKNYEYFEGNTIFWMGGRLQNARDRPINVATGVVMVLPVILFFVFSAAYLWHHVSPAVPIVFAYLFYVCFSSFLHASLVDPGIFPRNIHPFPPQDDDALAVGPPTNDWVMVRLATSETAAMDVPVKYCKTCNIWRPPRCYHCRVCDNCIETLDHHCVWLNNCVGRRNYRYFFTFVSSGTVVALYLSLASLGHVLAYMSQERVSFGTSINRNRVPFAMFIYGILALIYPLSLWGYHLLLTGRAETTREYLASRRFPKDERHRPFTLGNIFKNWIAVFARPKPPTYLHFKQSYEEGDQRFGSRRGNRQAGLNDQAKNGGMEMKHINPGVGTQNSFQGPHGRLSNGNNKKEPR